MTTNYLATDKLSYQIQLQSQKQFTGRLDVQGSMTWSLYFCLGRLVWATGGVHPGRRWYRHLSQYCPQVSPNGIKLRENDITKYWEYQVLTVLVKRQKITGEQAVTAIKSAVAEVLFDLLQYETKQPLTFACNPENVLDASLTLMSSGKAVQQAEEVWENWRNAGLTNLSPNMAPVLKEPYELEKLATPRVYQTLIKVIDGNRTLRDIAVYIKQDLLLLVRSLVPYIRKKIIGLVEVPDLPNTGIVPETANEQAKAESSVAPGTPAIPAPPISPTLPPQPTTKNKLEEPISSPFPPIPTTKNKGEVSGPTTAPPLPPLPTTKSLTSPPVVPTGSSAKPTVAYVEDSVLDSQIMEDILSKADYRFVSIRDSMQALPLLLQHKPDVIFLDLVMPVANGYEICAQIRRISLFKNTPVIILTGNDGIVDRVRAKLVGASDFISKPIAAQKVLATLYKHLQNSSPLPPDARQSLGYQAS